MISNQRRWQIDRVARGLCSSCGKIKIFCTGLCKLCYRKRLAYQRKWQAKNRRKTQKACADFRRKNPNYHRDYYQRLKVKNKP